MTRGTSSKNVFGNFGWAVLPFICLIGFWMLLRASGMINPTLLPSPFEVAQTFWTHLTEGDLAINAWMSVALLNKSEIGRHSCQLA